MKSKIIGIMAAGLLFAACGNKTTAPAPVDEPGDSDMAIHNRSVSGICGDGSAMNTLQFISDDGDTLILDVIDARENNKVLGGYACGDRMLVMMNDDKSEAEQVINETTLLGEWKLSRPSARDTITGICLKENRVAQRLGDGYLEYKSWDIVDGQFKLTGVNPDDGSTRTNTYTIVKLDADSLIYKDGEHYFRYVRYSK